MCSFKRLVDRFPFIQFEQRMAEIIHTLREVWLEFIHANIVRMQAL